MRAPNGTRAAAWVGFGLAGAIVHAVLWQISEPRDIFSDFYKAYYPTAVLLWQQGPQPTWIIPGTPEVGFVNIPIVAWLFVPLALLDEENAAWVFLGFGVAATAGAWALLVGLDRSGKKTGPALLFFFLANGPLVYSLREGNTTHFMLLFLVVALLLWSARWEFAAGLVLGVCAVIKLPLLLYGVYFLLRRRWRIVAGGATTIGVTAILSLAVFGVDINVGWYENCVVPFLGRVIPAFNVQSIDGFLMRLQTGAEDLLYWEPIEPTVIHKSVRIFLFAAVLGGAFLLLRRSGDGKHRAEDLGALSARQILEFVLVLALALVMSPLSWTHYYLLLLLPWGLYLGGRMSLPGDAGTRWLMWSGLLLSSLPVIFFPLQSGWGDFLLSRTVVSAWLFGALCILAAVVRGIYLADRRPPVGEDAIAP
jgi:Glycosyltransferase family 87